jgi:ATP-dependent protease HslVU (ClpYQ) peptidase subunit
MTTLVGIQTDDTVVMAADSQITEDNLRTISTATPKIVEVGRYLIGITGDTRPGDILSYNWKPPTFKSTDDPVQHMGRKVIPSIIKAFTDGGYDWANVDKKDGGFDYLISFNGNLFHIACDMSFIQNDSDLYAIGSGGQFATGYLYACKQKASGPWGLELAEDFAEEAILCATRFDVNTGLPVQIVTQDRI